MGLPEREQSFVGVPGARAGFWGPPAQPESDPNPPVTPSRRRSRRPDPAVPTAAMESSPRRRQRDPSPPAWDWDRPDARRRLEELYFGEQHHLRAGTEDAADFWAFFERLRRFQSQKSDREPPRETPREADAGAARLDLPRRYDPRYRINLAVPRGRRGDAGVPEKPLAEFRAAWLHYLDFAQKRSFAKLAKLQKERAALPIWRYRERIVGAVAENPVVVIAGDTGCGKSTQVPQFLLAAGYGRVACTQPRRVACVALAKRVALESLHQYGDQVRLGGNWDVLGFGRLAAGRAEGFSMVWAPSGP